jgi:hypothetical protein
MIKAGFSVGWGSALDGNGRTIWIVDAHRDDGKRFVVQADEKLTAFLELESEIRGISHFHDPCTVKPHRDRNVRLKSYSPEAKAYYD